MTEVINILYVSLPGGMHGATVLNDDGSFTVMLDPNDPPDVQREGFDHEYFHISNGDFDNICDKNHREIENRAHKKRL